MNQPTFRDAIEAALELGVNEPGTNLEYRRAITELIAALYIPAPTSIGRDMVVTALTSDW